MNSELHSLFRANAWEWISGFHLFGDAVRDAFGWSGRACHHPKRRALRRAVAGHQHRLGNDTK